MRIFRIVTVLLAFGVLFSCRSSKDLIFLKDTEHEEISELESISNTTYRLKVGDILYVSIKSTDLEVNMLFNPESNMENNTTGNIFQKYTTPAGAYLYGYEIDKDGNINLPILGKIAVSGIEQSQVESIVQQKADEYLKDAIVKVRLLNYRITVMGEVRSPGNYYVYKNTLTVIEAIAMANGNTDYASIKDVMIVRNYPEGAKTFMLDLSSKSIYSSDAYFLQPNDYVFVRPDKYKNFQLNSQANSLFFTSLSVIIAVLSFVLK